MYIRKTSSELKKCELTNGDKLNVLEIVFTQAWNPCRILIKDVEDTPENIKDLEKQAREKAREYFKTEVWKE